MQRVLYSEAETEAFAARIAKMARRGDCFALIGDLGAGKTTFARGFIQALAGEVAVTSPTFLLVQTYDSQPATLYHFDLYRLKAAEEAVEIGLAEALDSGIVLIEWPEMVMEGLPMSTLKIAISEGAEGGRAFDISGGRLGAMEAFLDAAGWVDAEREPLPGDASFRRYIRLRKGKETAMLMDAPPEREDVQPYVEVAKHLHASGYAAPAVMAADAAQGFVLSEDLGDALYTRVLSKTSVGERGMYEAAVDVLAAWHKDKRMRKGSALSLPEYDDAVLLREVGLFSEWFLPAVLPEGAGLAKGYMALWKELIMFAGLPCEAFVHRDYHADNLLWLKGGRVGMLDFQDALYGHEAYDLVSLLEDARRDVSPELAEAMIARYLKATGMEEKAFRVAYAFLGAQRNSKIIGIFTRLSRRDGKHHYLQHLPRVWRYLERDVKHPALAALSRWLEAHVPAGARGEIARP